MGGGLLWRPHGNEGSRLRPCYFAILIRWLPPDGLRWLLRLQQSHLHPSQRGEGSYGVEGGETLSLSNDMSHMTVLIMSQWVEFGHKATSSCKRGWEMKFLILGSQANHLN